MCSFIADLQKYVYMFHFLRGRGGPHANYCVLFCKFKSEEM